jgi:aldehyde dehydrogenase (NAD+)
MTLTEYGALFVGGRWTAPRSDAKLEVINPWTEEVIGSAPDADAEDVHATVQEARRSFDQGSWRRLSITERIGILENALAILEAEADDLARLLTEQMGLPYHLATGHIPYAIGFARYLLSVAPEAAFAESRITACGPAMIFREPVGVAAGIAPWNGPFQYALAKSIPALVAGCSVVFKPAPETPFDAYRVARAFQEAGVPAGAFNLISGGADTGRALVAHPGVDKVSFTGSTATGREIGRMCGYDFKRMQLELGGKSAAIILEDAKVEDVEAGIRAGSFTNTGQNCCAYTRVLIPRTRRDELTEVVKRVAESFVLGEPDDPATTMGPLVSRRQYEKVLGYIELGLQEGAKLVTGGGRPNDVERGFFVAPTVFEGARNDMRICREEIFGPVVALIAYNSLDEAVDIANDSDYGLHGAVFTQDPAIAMDVTKRVRAGTFSVNSFTYNYEIPFGGMKNSGVGRDTGPQAVQAYFELKAVNLDGSMAFEDALAGTPPGSK